MQQAAVEGVKVLLSGGELYGADSVRKEFSITPEVISSPEIQEAAKNGAVKLLGIGNIEMVKEIQEKFLLSAGAIIQSVEKEIIKRLENGEYGVVARIKKGFSFSTNFISSPEVQEATKKCVVKCLSRGSVGDAIHTKEDFALSAENTETAVADGMLVRLTNSSRGNLIDDAMRIRDSFSLSAEVCRKVARDAVAHILASGNDDYALKIQNQFALSPEDVSYASKQAFLKCSGNGKDKIAEHIREKFKVSVNSEDILNYFPEVRTLLSELRNVSPEFAVQAEKMPDLLLSLLQFRSDPSRILNVVKKNPFLLDAVSGNPRFGSRLLVKYPQFDSLSKEKIKTQFACKKKDHGRASGY